MAATRSEADNKPSIEKPSDSRARALRASLMEACSLRREMYMAPHEYGALVIHHVYALQGRRLGRGTKVDLEIFSTDAATTLEESPVAEPVKPGYRSEDFGPFAEDPGAMWNFIHNGPNIPKEALKSDRVTAYLLWGPQCDRVLLSARRRCSRRWRALESLEQWLIGVHTLLPLLTRWLYAVLGFIAGAIVVYLWKR